MSLITGIKVGKTDITSTYIDNTSGSDTKEFTVTAVSLGSISVPESTTTYTGSAIEQFPTVTAIVNGETVVLDSGTDYDWTYTNNVNVSTNQVKATVTATGKGNFTGTVSTTWMITPKEAVLSWGQTSWTYDGNEHHTECSVINLEGNDTCTVTLSGNSITNIGQTTVTATGLSNSNYSLPTDRSVVLTVLAGMFVKLSGVWTPVKKVFKKVGGSWIQQTFGEAFSTSEAYVKKN